MYAIINKKTKKFVYGTDYRRVYKNRVCAQRTSFNRALTYDDKIIADLNRRSRHMSKDYIIVEVELKVISHKKKA